MLGKVLVISDLRIHETMGISVGVIKLFQSMTCRSLIEISCHHLLESRSQLRANAWGFGLSLRFAGHILDQFILRFALRFCKYQHECVLPMIYFQVTRNSHKSQVW